MGMYRDAFESEMRPGGPRPTYGRPARAEALDRAERALGLPLPGPLRALYRDFDGLRHLTVGPEIGADRPMSVDAFDLYDILPLRLLPAARDALSRWYGRVGRSLRKGRVSLEDEEKYAAFERELCRCVAIRSWDNATTFLFLTDQNAWGIGPDQVAWYDHVGGPDTVGDSVLKWLVGLGRIRTEHLD